MFITALNGTCDACGGAVRVVVHDFKGFSDLVGAGGLHVVCEACGSSPQAQASIYDVVKRETPASAAPP